MRSPRMALAWLQAGAAIAIMGLFVERRDGHVTYSFNFAWTGHLAAYVLFLATTTELLRLPVYGAGDPRGNSQHAESWRAWLVGVALSLHVVSGLAYYLKQALGLGFF